MSVFLNPNYPTPYPEKSNYHPHVEQPPTPAPAESVDQWLAAARSWAAQRDTSSPLVLVVPDHKDLLRLKEVLLKEGIRFRCDWYSDTRLAVLRMPLEIHEIPINWWLLDIMPRLRDQLRAAAVCNRWEPRTSGSPSCTTNTGSDLQPDSCIWVTKSENPRTGLGELPRVVIEVAVSQSQDLVMRKAWDWLHNGNLDVHAVVVLKLSYPVTEKRDFKAEIGVWVRGRTGTDTDYPLDTCAREPSDQIPFQPFEPPSQSSPLSEGSTTCVGSDMRSSWQSESTAVDLEPGYYVPDGAEAKIYVRSLQPIVLINESDPESVTEREPKLSFDAYDFIRLCELNPDKVIDDSQRKITLPLDSLRDHILRVVEKARALPTDEPAVETQPPVRTNRPKSPPKGFYMN